MQQVWREYGPPAYVAVAAYLGLNKPRSGVDDLIDSDELAGFLAQFPGARAPAAS